MRNLERGGPKLCCDLNVATFSSSQPALLVLLYEHLRAVAAKRDWRVLRVENNHAEENLTLPPQLLATLQMPNQGWVMQVRFVLSPFNEAHDALARYDRLHRSQGQGDALQPLT